MRQSPGYAAPWAFTSIIIHVCVTMMVIFLRDDMWSDCWGYLLGFGTIDTLPQDFATVWARHNGPRVLCDGVLSGSYSHGWHLQYLYMD